MKKLAPILLFAAICLGGGGRLHAQTVEIFSGVEINYRNIYFHRYRIFDKLTYLTPSVKLHLGKDWTVAAQVYVPVINQYGDYYKKIRPNMALVSKEMQTGAHLLKFSGGLFGSERYGLDAKWMWAVNDWMALDGELGLTGRMSMAENLVYSKMGRLTGWIGARLYHKASETELRGRAGRFLNADYGIEGEWFKHFTHCSIGLYAQHSSVFGNNGGFKIVAAIPKEWRTGRKVVLRPASNVRLTYNINALPGCLKTYPADPEENEREGFFDNSRWGLNRNRP